jgi:hypothetical protein
MIFKLMLNVSKNYKWIMDLLCLKFWIVVFCNKCVTSIGKVNRNDLLYLLFYSGNQDGNFSNIYIKPYTRVAPYVVGFYTGYLLYKTKNNVKIPKVKLLFVFQHFKCLKTGRSKIKRKRVKVMFVYSRK